MKILNGLIAVVGTVLMFGLSRAAEPMLVWPELAPGESTRRVGEALPAKPGESPPVTRLVDITCPTLTVHRAAEPNGTGVLILPGGGFSKVVPDKEGTEAAEWLNQLGATAFVLRYRTQASADDPGWRRPLQDAQRSLALIRTRAAEFQLQPDRIGLLGFSAGGQVAARLLSAEGRLAYPRIDAIDDTSHRPDFALLIYPWNLYDRAQEGLVEGVQVSENFPATYLVHTDDDASSSLGTVLLYAGLKRHAIPSELHVYGNGGHGYGLRTVKGSQISSWTEHAAHWLSTRGLVAQPSDSPR